MQNIYIIIASVLTAVFLGFFLVRLALKNKFKRQVAGMSLKKLRKRRDVLYARLEKSYSFKDYVEYEIVVREIAKRSGVL